VLACACLAEFCRVQQCPSNQSKQAGFINQSRAIWLMRRVSGQVACFFCFVLFFFLSFYWFMELQFAFGMPGWSNNWVGYLAFLFERNN